MEVDVRELGKSRVTVHIRLDADEVRSAFDKTYQELSNRGGIRGFRPGKVPRAILDRHYDRDGIRAVTYETLVKERLAQAMEEHNLRPIDRVEIEVGAPPAEEDLLAERIRSGLAQSGEADGEEAGGASDPPQQVAEDEQTEEEEEERIPLEEGEPFEFYTTFTAYPRAKLPDFSELTLRRPVVEVTEEQVDDRIEQLRRIHAVEVEADRDTIEEGDRVTVEVKVLTEGEDAAELKPVEQEIVVGEREYLGDIDQALIGHAPGDIVEKDFEYGTDHPDPELAGRSGRIIAKIASFAARKLPELTDEFAQEVGEFATVADLRAAIRNQLVKAAEEQAQRELQGQLIRYIIEQTQIELPEELVAPATEGSYDELRRELQQRGMSMAEFVELAQLDEEQIRENQRERAETELKLHFAIEALARELDIQVTEEDVSAELERVARQSGGDLTFVRQAAMLQRDFADELRDRVLHSKVIEHLIARARIEDVPAAEYQAASEQVTSEETTQEPTAQAEPATDAHARVGEAASPPVVETDQESENG
ncbi:MAG: trigger factor [Armatimonadota bacterium]